MKTPQSKKSALKNIDKPGANRRKATDDRRPQRSSDGRFLPGNSLGRQFKAGNSAGAKGRRDSITDVLRRRLPEIRVEDDGRSNAELIADMLLEEAIEKGNIQAAREIFDRVEGKAKQAIDITVKKSENEMYEGMITDLMEYAASKNLKLTRDEAIEYLARHDARILDVIDLASEKVQ
jgi:hypothetical protein